MTDLGVDMTNDKENVVIKPKVNKKLSFGSIVGCNDVETSLNKFNPLNTKILEIFVKNSNELEKSLKLNSGITLHLQKTFKELTNDLISY